MEQTKYDVFISYRRKGGSEKAQLVKSELRQREVKEESIFLDTHSLYDGDFEQKIKVAIEQSMSVVVIISKGCFDEVKETDFWYMEIREALLQGKKIIPVFFDGITSFATLNVPKELLDLTKKNAVTYQHEYADAAFDKLIMFIGIQKETHKPAKKRGCLFSFKYKGCLLSVVLCGIIVFVLAPITLMRFESTSSPNEGDEVYYTHNEGECPPACVEQKEIEETADCTSPPPDVVRQENGEEPKHNAANASPSKKNEELYGRWRGLDDKLVISFQARKVIMEKNDNGIVKTEQGEYSVNGNRIVFYWKDKGSQIVQYEIGSDILRLTFDNDSTIILVK